MNYKFILFLGLLAAILESCVTRKPDCSYVSDADYNQRVIISNPHYRKKTNVIGIAFNIGTTVAGAYSGYEFLPLVKYKKGETLQNFKPANAAIGAVVGFSVGYLLNNLAGNNKKLDLDDPNRWLRKSNNEFRLLSNNFSSMTVINKNIEPNFLIRSFNDYSDFITLFPNSNRKEEIIAECSGKEMSRNDLKYIIDQNPNSENTKPLKKEYILKAQNLEDLFISDKLYPETVQNLEEYSINYVKSIKNLKDFHSRFPRSKNTYNLTDKIMTNSSFYEIEQFLSDYDYFPNIRSAKIWCIKKAPSISKIKSKFEKYDDVLSEGKFQELAYNLIGKSTENAIEFSKIISNSKYKKDMGDGEIYIGMLSNEKREGYGFLLKNDKVLYKGDWKNDLKNGYGEEYFDDVFYYKGNFVNNYYEGHGEYKNEKTKENYIGSFKDGVFNGNGALTFETTDIGVTATVKGNFIDGRIEGQGRADYSDSRWYEGGFSNGLPHGIGTFRTKDGYRITGKYEYGNRVGKHTYKSFILFGLVDTERGEIDYGNGDKDPTIKETFNINKKSSDDNSGNSEQKSCIKKFEEAENWDELTFKFSGYDYKVFASNMVYKIKCEDHKGYIVMLDHNTRANSFWDSNWEKGWYYYEYNLFGDHKSGPFKTLNEAKKKSCNCN